MPSNELIRKKLVREDPVNLHKVLSPKHTVVLKQWRNIGRAEATAPGCHISLIIQVSYENVIGRDDEVNV